MRPLKFALCALVLSAATTFAQAPVDTSKETRLLRFPATNGSQIVFTYAGNLYTVGMDVVTSRRLS